MPLLGLIGGLIGLILGTVGLLIGIFFGLIGLFFVAPFVILFAILGLLLWDPLLWLGLGLGIYLLYRIAKKKDYIQIRRVKK
jgi:hypothetical protein